MRRLALLLLAAVALTACGGASRPAVPAPRLALAAPRLEPRQSAPTFVNLNGPPTVGQTLTSSTGTWTNNPTSFAYQWLRCSGSCSNIQGAVTSTYVVQSADLADAIEVTVTASNPGGSASQTSAATSAVINGASGGFFGNQAVGGTPNGGMTADFKRVTSATANNSGEVTKVTMYLSPTGTAGTQTLRNVIYSDSTGNPSAFLGVSDEISFSQANAAGWYDLTLPDSVAVTSGSTYWLGMITGPTNAVIQFNYDVVGSATTWEFSSDTYSDGPSNPFGASAENDPWRMSVYATVAPSGSPTPSVRPALSGSASVGNVLASTTGTWSGSPTGFTYQWQDCDSGGINCQYINGATNSSYTIAAGDVGHTIRSVVLASNAIGSSSRTSVVSSVVAGSAPGSTVLPSITGTSTQGQTLTVSNGTWTGNPTSFAYQWRDCDSAGNSCSDVTNGGGGSTGTAATYTLQASDVAHTMRAVVTATNANGSTPATSAQSALVVGLSAPANTALPVVSGTATVGSTLSSTNGTWTSGGSAATCGGGTITCTHKWQRCSPSCSDIVGATGSTYVLVSADSGDTIDAVVTATNGSGSTPATSAQTATITGGGGGVVVNYFVAQSSAGTGAGTSCANASAVSTLSTSTHWTAGNVIGLCGTITSTITAQASGTSGNPITLFWEPGAKLSQPFCPGDNTSSGCFNTNGQTNLTLDGGTNGIIESSANGSLLANHVSAVVGIRAMACNGCTIKNLTIQNMYVHLTNNSTNDSIQHSQNNAIRFSGSNLTIQNNTIHDAGWALNQVLASGVNDSNVTIAGNDIYNSDHTWALQGPPVSGGNFGPFVFSGNHAHDWGNWDNAANSYHHDGLHCFSQNNVGATPHYNGVYLFNNRWDGSNGDLHMTSDIFLEGSSSGGTPCSDNTSNFYIFNNVFIGTDGIGNGLMGLEDNTASAVVDNNTLIGPFTTNTSNGNVCQYNFAMAVTYKNNTITTCNSLIQKLSGSSFAAGSPDFNTYANAGSNAFVCGGVFSSSFTTWKTCTGGDSHGQSVGSAGLNADGSPAGGSATLNAGTNLTSLCAGNLTALCTTYAGPPAGGGAGSATSGTARPTGATAWDAGAY